MSAARRALVAGLAGLAGLAVGAACGPREPRRRTVGTSPPAAPAAPPAADAGAAPSPAAATPWLKGQLHAHTIASGDSRTPLADAVRFYAEHGYDFVVITDHNRVTEPPAGAPGSILVLPGIELTHNPARCDPPPPRPGGACRIHVNALVVRNPAAAALPWKQTHSDRRIDMYQAALDQVRALDGIAQINHPRWHYGVDGALLAELGRRGALLVEVANQGFERWNQADGDQPSAEAVWDAALSEGVVLWGVASDDAHHYYDADRARAAGGPVYPAGRGFVMVHAQREAAAIRAALAHGDFYASTGVLLSSAGVVDGALVVEVAGESPGGACRIDFIGAGGRVLSTVDGRAARFALAEAPPGYVRAVVTDAQGQKAWVQPALVPR